MKCFEKNNITNFLNFILRSCLPWLQLSWPFVIFRWKVNGV
ncbi:unnamed protein product, partial [Vitis vinifera]